MGRRRLFPWKQPRSDSLVVCDVDPALTEKLRKFRFRKETNNAAILMKIDKERQLVVLEEEFQDISPEELKSELPERQVQTGAADDVCWEQEQAGAGSRAHQGTRAVPPL
uniref:Glia maturation factor gamma n=1 Tax=Chelonoidis abingdonii TaxID=106734 RepID=A0A8C0GM87_CHEAB